MNSQDKQKEIDSLKSKKETLDEKHNTLSTKMYEEIEVIRNKYKEELDGYQTEINDLRDKISTADKERRAMIVEENWQEATSRGEINEFYIDSLLAKAAFDKFWIENIAHKKTLKNGIDVWMVFSDGTEPFKFYIAFYNGGIVGTSFRPVAQHAGDDTYPYSFIGTFDEYVMFDREIKSGRLKGSTRPEKANYTEWMRLIKDIDPDENFIPINDETLEEIKMGVKDYWYTWGWAKRQKELESK